MKVFILINFIKIIRLLIYSHNFLIQITIFISRNHITLCIYLFNLTNLKLPFFLFFLKKT
ncbi:hypothetical protein H8356DRAFT_1645857 [Neocallimastix lanati (nom. inval.)]|nr:hypothetical protein H8356DRAFT_1645857 [Neocallimastix sp. JGI-2020a]